MRLPHPHAARLCPFLPLSTITPVVGKKRKRNASSDNSDAEVMPAQSPREEEETSVQVGARLGLEEGDLEGKGLLALPAATVLWFMPQGEKQLYIPVVLLHPWPGGQGVFAPCPLV